MLKNLVLAGLVIGLAAILTFGLNTYFKSEKGDFFMLETGQKIPNFSFETLDGTSYEYSSFTDQPTIIHFWATWCAPCVVEFPDLVEFATDNPNVTVLAFSSDRNEQAINRFLATYAPDLPDNFMVAHDKNSDITNGKFSVFKLPETFIAKEQGIVDRHIQGAYADWSDLKL